MSLDTLISIVATDLQLSEEEAIQTLLTIADVIGGREFTWRTLITTQLTQQYIHKVISDLQSAEYLTKEVNYTCETSEMVETTESETDRCEGCGNLLSEDIDNHELTIIYHPTEQFDDDIRQLKEKLLKSFILAGYLPNLRLLQRRRKDIVPFLGAGIAVPLGVPGWKRLLIDMKEFLKDESYHRRYMEFFQSGDFLKALSYLKTNSVVLATDEQIKTHIVDVIEEKLNLNVGAEKHNIMDLELIGSNLYLTTNYEISLSKFLSKGTPPLLLNEVEDISKTLRENKQRVVHLHGMVDKPSSMIVSIEDYEKLYESDDFKHKLTAIMSNKVLLFIGWSFADQFFKDLYTKIREMVGGEHFIVVANPDSFDAQDWAKIGLRTIGLKVKLKNNGDTDYDDYVRVLRLLLKEIGC